MKCFKFFLILLLVTPFSFSSLALTGKSTNGMEHYEVVTKVKHLKLKEEQGLMFMHAELLSTDNRIAEFYGTCENTDTGETKVCFYNTNLQLNKFHNRKVLVGKKNMYRRQLVNTFKLPQGSYKLIEVTTRRFIGIRSGGRHAKSVSSSDTFSLKEFDLNFKVDGDKPAYLGMLTLIIEPNPIYLDTLRRVQVKSDLATSLATVKNTKVLEELSILFEGKEAALKLETKKGIKKGKRPGQWFSLTEYPEWITKACETAKNSQMSIDSGLVTITNKSGFPVFTSRGFSEKMACGLSEYMKANQYSEFRQTTTVKSENRKRLHMPRERYFS